MNPNDFNQTPQGMQNVPPQQNTPPPQMPPSEPPVQKRESHVGAWIGIIIIVALLALGGLYFWGKELDKRAGEGAMKTENIQTPEEILNAPDEATAALETQGTSDAASAIEADLNATNLDDLDKELNDIDSELNF